MRETSIPYPSLFVEYIGFLGIGFRANWDPEYGENNEYQKSTFMIHEAIWVNNLPNGLRGLTIGLEILKTKHVSGVEGLYYFSQTDQLGVWGSDVAKPALSIHKAQVTQTPLLSMFIACLSLCFSWISEMEKVS